MDTGSKAFKGLVVVLAAAIVVVGALLLVKTFGPAASGEIDTNLPEGMSIEDMEGVESREFIIDENGHVTEGGESPGSAGNPAEGEDPGGEGSGTE